MNQVEFQKTNGMLQLLAYFVLFETTRKPLQFLLGLLLSYLTQQNPHLLRQFKHSATKCTRH